MRQTMRNEKCHGEKDEGPLRGNPRTEPEEENASDGSEFPGNRLLTAATVNR